MTAGFLNPAGALAFAAVGVLVVLYLRGRRRRVVAVPALFLWRDVPMETPSARRFRPDLLFLAQLAVLVALIGGLLRPYVASVVAGDAPERLLIVLDVSASMQAREADGTRFELARRRARALVAQLMSGDEVMLVTAAERAHVVLRWTADHALAQGRLESLEPLDTPTALAPALELALGERAARPETRVFVLTDLPREASGVSRERVALVDYVQIGRTDDNVAIAGLALDRPAFRDAAEASMTVLVRSYSGRPHEVVLEARVGDRPWARRTLALAPRASEHVLLTDPPGTGAVEVALRTGDALAVDDRAVAWLADEPPLDALVVTTSPELADAFARLADGLPGARVRVRDPTEWTRDDGAHVAVLDGVDAPDVPIPALYVEPPPGHPLCPTDPAVDDAAVADWDADHPALRGLDALEAVTLPRAHPLRDPGWARTLVVAATARRAFPLLVAGERAGRRVACLGARPAASADGLPLLVVVLNALRWLEEPADGVPLAVETGVPVVVDETGSGDHPVVLAEHAGFQRVGARLVAANLIDDRESDIGRSESGEWPAAESRRQTVGRRELGWWLFVAAAVLLASEWLAWRRRA